MGRSLFLRRGGKECSKSISNTFSRPEKRDCQRYHISDTAKQRAVKIAVQKAVIVKRATVHTLRHSFATHQLMYGVSIREVQDVLGHINVETTMIYTHVATKSTLGVRSPLDK